MTPTPSPPPGYVLVEDMLRLLPFERVRELCIGRHFHFYMDRPYYRGWMAPGPQVFLCDLREDLSSDVRTDVTAPVPWPPQPHLCIQIDLCDLLGD